jgi:hypothetical protein
MHPALFVAERTQFPYFFLSSKMPKNLAEETDLRRLIGYDNNYQNDLDGNQQEKQVSIWNLHLPQILI